ncbi:MAG TPA: hypothetical protein PKY77_07655 [Phycisphaerae bacterium]|nr:hypothetical protein [Phycisphaerae bacterium]HRY67876.1 hypothetical protein [Phycisphaerae bacterium]HSA25330.1 hypothetical protein [Phycisphaerae bacterium]
MRPEESELLRHRLDYAWRYFESAARQRMLFFNYYLIVMGILVNGYVLAIREGLIAVAVFVCVFGILSCLVFMAFDVRTLRFVRMAVDILEHLERSVLFCDGFPSVSNQLGLMRREADQRHGAKSCWLTFRARLFDHKYWIRGMQLLILLAFALGVYYAMSRTGSPPVTTGG